MHRPTPTGLRDSRPTSRSEPEVFGTDSAMSVFSRPPTGALDSVDFAFSPSLLRRAEPRGEHSHEPPSWLVRAAPCSPCPRTNAASASLCDQAAARRPDPGLTPTA